MTKETVWCKRRQRLVEKIHWTNQDWVDEKRRNQETANDPGLIKNPYLRAVLNLKPAQPQTKTQSLNEMIDSGEIGY